MNILIGVISIVIVILIYGGLVYEEYRQSIELANHNKINRKLAILDTTFEFGKLVFKFLILSLIVSFILYCIKLP